MPDSLNNSFRVGVIGCGRWGPNHVRVLEEILGPGNVIACEPDRDRRVAFATRYPHVPVHESPELLIADSELQAVVIATPAHTHFDLAMMALQAGKHVLCEKPFTSTVREAEVLKAQADLKGCVLMIGHVFLYNAALAYVRTICQDGTLGTLRYAIATRTNLGPIRTDVDVAADLASHDIAVLNWVTGRVPQSVSAVGASYIVKGHADTAFITLSYSGDFKASVQTSWLHPEKVRQLTIVGSQRMLKWNDLDLDAPITVYDKHVETEPRSSTYGDFLRFSTHTGEVRHPYVPFYEPLKAQAQAFLTAIRDGGSVQSNAESALAVMQVLEAIAESFAGNGIPVYVQSIRPNL